MTYVLGFFGLGIQELVIVMVILLVLFGGKQLPVLMRNLGRSATEFKKGVQATEDEHHEETSKAESNESNN